MKIVASLRDMQSLALRWKRRGVSVGFVPTLGALHQGHLSLFRRARRENDVLVVSIFVNPAQFGPGEDLSRYPRPWSRDRRLAAAEKTDVLFRPSAADMYPDGFQTAVSPGPLAETLCGPFRPGHFRGVATVVAKLLSLVQPTKAYFGLKDFQQFRIVERLAADLNLPVEIVPCPTVREADGLARSSRNAYLTPAQRRNAGRIPLALQSAGELIKFRSPISSSEALRPARRVLREIPGARIDYLQAVDPLSLKPLRRLRRRALVAAAVRLGRARLIDNLLVGPLETIGSREVSSRA